MKSIALKTWKNRSELLEDLWSVNMSESRGTSLRCSGVIHHRYLHFSKLWHQNEMSLKTKGTSMRRSFSQESIISIHLWLFRISIWLLIITTTQGKMWSRLKNPFFWHFFLIKPIQACFPWKKHYFHYYILFGQQTNVKL